MSDAVARTRNSFGVLWRETAKGRVATHGRSHVERACAAVGLTLPLPARSILDAGCGPGADLNYLADRHPGTRVFGIDANDAIEVPARATATSPRVTVLRASVLEPPFRTGSFDFVYSYGVLHHTEDPARGFARLADLVAPGGRILIYVYTDLREEPALRAALAAVTAVRRLTTRLSPRAVLGLARLGAPVVYFLFGLPAAMLRRTTRGGQIAERLPFNFVASPTGAVGDLYDRFSAPIEHRHSRREIDQWFRSAGLEDILITSMPDARGWVATGRRHVALAN